jgi:hypothetical protein
MIDECRIGGELMAAAGGAAAVQPWIAPWSMEKAGAAGVPATPSNPPPAATTRAPSGWAKATA